MLRLKNYERKIKLPFIIYANFEIFLVPEDNGINSMPEESKYYSDVMKNHLNKELVMTKRYDEDFDNSTKCWIYDDDYVEGDVKVRNHCHIKI